MVEGERICGVRLADGECVEAPVVVNAAGSWANLLMRPLQVGLPFTPVRSHFWITKIDEGRFPAGHPFTVIPDARAFTRSDVGALIIGLRESHCQAFDPAAMTEKLEDFDFHKEAEWTVLDECASLLKPYLHDIEDLPIAHYMAGPSCYVPDAMFIIGAVHAYKGLFTVTGCCGGGVAAGGTDYGRDSFCQSGVVRSRTLRRGRPVLARVSAALRRCPFEQERRISLGFVAHAVGKVSSFRISCCTLREAFARLNWTQRKNSKW